MTSATLRRRAPGVRPSALRAGSGARPCRGGSGGALGARPGRSQDKGGGGACRGAQRQPDGGAAPAQAPCGEARRRGRSPAREAQAAEAGRARLRRGEGERASPDPLGTRGFRQKRAGGRGFHDLHGLIFETSICYWQDQPGSPGGSGRVAAGRDFALGAPAGGARGSQCGPPDEEGRPSSGEGLRNNVLAEARGVLRGGVPPLAGQGWPTGRGLRGRTAGAGQASRSRYRSFGLGGAPEGFAGPSAWPSRPWRPTRRRRNRPPEHQRKAGGGALRWRVWVANRVGFVPLVLRQSRFRAPGTPAE
ncbi:hypothetical protein Q5P01_000025 [Channa striata]|uniref:Uncharacterized protein n=1 Tax=Channa striata TaxID=64152 RepID=A0AA88IJB8_CHASR|nr:hypothetical protein Q5P01_000025 [Channa striata]